MAKEKDAPKKKYGNVFSDKDLEEHVDAYKEQQANFAATGGGKKFPTYFELGEGEEAIVRFMQKDPVKFWQHRVWDPEVKKGSGGYRNFSCTRTSDCPLCEAGDKPSFKVAWQINHVDNIEKDGEVKPRLKLFVRGIRFGEYYTKKTEKNDPTTRNVTLERIGSGQNTQYLFSEWGEKGKLEYDKEEVVDLEEFFGLDDEKYEAMERVGSVLAKKQSKSGEERSGKEYTGAKKGSKSRYESDDDIPF